MATISREIGDLVSEWRTLKERMSCVTNNLSSQIKLYVPVITTVNAKAANEVLTIGQVCATLQKYAWPW